jgi:hypothetical protein
MSAHPHGALLVAGMGSGLGCINSDTFMKVAKARAVFGGSDPQHAHGADAIRR